METENKNVVFLSMEVLKQLKEFGLASASLQSNQFYLQRICNYYAASGCLDYDPAKTRQLLEDLYQQTDAGMISKGYLNAQRRAILFLDEMYNHHSISWKQKLYQPKFLVSPYYENLIQDFLQTQQLSESTLSGMRSMLRKFCVYLEKSDRKSIADIRPDDFPRYVAMSGLSGRSLDYMKYSVKKLYSYLQETQGIPILWKNILDEPCICKIKIQPYTTGSELNSILAQVETTTAKGKRDFACILLAAKVGMRASDIINLKLCDIDWRSFEIRIIQKKTHSPLALPMPVDVAEAIKDYILNGRPESDSEYIFLRTRAPYWKIEKGVSLIQMFKQYQIMAGITRTAYDGKSFHSLRRGLGHNMVIAGIPVTTISQVLGHSNLDSSKPYLSLDTQNLKLCALDLRGIEEGMR